MDGRNKTNESSLLDLRNDEIKYIISQAPEMTAVMARVSKRMNSIFQPTLNELKVLQMIDHMANQRHDEANEMFESLLNSVGLDSIIKLYVYKLLHHIVFGQQAEAEAMIKANPKVLLEKSTLAVIDYSGRKIVNVTPLQLALGADDHHMWQMILPYFNELPEGKEKLSEQFNEFDRGCADEETYDFSTLIDAFNSNEQEKMDAAIAEFQKHFQPGVIHKGKHFNINHLLEACKVYIVNFDAWNDDDRNRRNTFWQKVIGHLQRLVPACLAQAYCERGLKNAFDKPHELRRSLKINSDNVFFPLDKKPDFVLGQNFAVYRYYALLGWVAQAVESIWGLGHPNGCYFELRNLCATKTECYVRLKSDVEYQRTQKLGC